jgi:hypothetical protein
MAFLFGEPRGPGAAQAAAAGEKMVFEVPGIMKPEKKSASVRLLVG